MKLNLNRKLIVPAAPAQITNLRLLDVGAAAEAAPSPFAGLNYTPDDWTAYLDFDICYSLPDITGPVSSGNYIGYWASTLASSQSSLMHKQFNLRHMIKAYNPPTAAAAGAGAANLVARDRIVGCIVATSFPKLAMGQQWQSAANAEGATGCISARAAVFKLAEGVPKILGEHLASRTTQSVSIEVTTPLDNIGLYLPSTRQLCGVFDASDEMVAAAKQPKGGGFPVFGQVNGEQLVVVYGMGAPVSFQGVGMTPRPAERKAKIVSVAAEHSQMFAIAAESVVETLVGETVKFRTGRAGTIVAVTKEGEARVGALRMKAKENDPVVTISLPDGARVLLPFSGIAEKLSKDL